MTTEQVKNWIKTQDADFAGRIRLGGVDGNAEYFLGVSPGNAGSQQRVALGGAAYTVSGTFPVRLYLRWGRSQPQAEAKAQALWGLFYARTGVNMDGAKVAFVDPGAGPVPLGKGSDGVFEYVINLNITYMKE